MSGNQYFMNSMFAAALSRPPRGTASTEAKVAYATALGERVTRKFRDNRYIGEKTCEGIYDLNGNISRETAIGLALAIKDATIRTLSDIIKNAVFATDFDEDTIMEVIRKKLVHSMKDIYDQVAQDPSDEDDVAVVNVSWRIERILAKGLKGACEDLSMDDEEIDYDGEDGSYFIDGFFDDFNAV